MGATLIDAHRRTDMARLTGAVCDYTDPHKMCLYSLHKGVWGNGGIVSVILYLSTRWGPVVSVMLWSLCSPKHCQYPLNWKLGLPQGQSWHFVYTRWILPSRTVHQGPCLHVLQPSATNEGLRTESRPYKHYIWRGGKFTIECQLMLQLALYVSIILVHCNKYKFFIKKVNQSHYRPEVSRGFQEVKVPTLCDNGPEWW